MYHRLQGQKQCNCLHVTCRLLFTGRSSSKWYLKNSVLTAKTTTHHHYKDHTVNAVYGNNRCLQWESYETSKYKMNYWLFKQTVNTVITGFWSIKQWRCYKNTLWAFIYSRVLKLIILVALETVKLLIFLQQHSKKPLSTQFLWASHMRW
jgi:hypothetical protein